MTLAPIREPSEFGLPYPDWRVGQLEAVEGVNALLKENNVVFLIADTGTGKTGIATALSHSYSTSSVLCPTISLEEQYEEITGLEGGRGRAHWPCGRGIDPVICGKQEMCESPCEYKSHIWRMQSQRMRILNYAQFFALNETQKGFKTDLVVCDEGHGVENHLQNFVDMWEGEGDGESLPTWGYEYKHLLFNSGRKFVFMSASMIPALISQTMGISEYAVYEAQNDFNPTSNPVFVSPVGYITANRPHTDRIVNRIDKHIASAGFNGVVHCASDRQVEDILSQTKYRELFIYPKGRTRAAAFTEFKTRGQTGKKAVLISASSHEGQDFPGNECRWQIICKVPYASLGSPHVRARRAQRPDIYRLEALQKIQQMCGRGMRSADDWCVNYILDATVIDLMAKLGTNLSTKFRQSWMGVQNG